MEADETSAIEQESQCEESSALEAPLEIAQKNVLAMQSVLNELALLKAEHAQLRSDYYDVKKNYEKLQACLAVKEEEWEKFKVWWKELLGRKNKSNSNALFNTHGRADAIPSSPLSVGEVSVDNIKKSKSRFTKEDVKLLGAYGLAIPTSSTSATPSSKVIKVEAADENITQMAPFLSSKVDRRSFSDGAIESNTLESDSKKRRRDSSLETSLSRKILGDVSNANSDNSISPPPDAVEEEEDERGMLLNQNHIVDKRKEPTRDLVRLKGRGRYSNGMTKEGDISKTLLAQYEIDPERNGNVAHLHKTVVRNKVQRKQMHGFDCPCCADYYAAVGQAPLRKYQDPRTLQLQRGDNEENGNSSSTDDETSVLQLHRQQISRHRGYGPPASTPPAYWETGFPDTQRQQEINELARQEHLKKREQLAKDPRFKKRIKA